MARIKVTSSTSIQVSNKDRKFGASLCYEAVAINGKIFLFTRDELATARNRAENNASDIAHIKVKKSSLLKRLFGYGKY